MTLTRRDNIYLKLVRSLARITTNPVFVLVRDGRAVASTIEGLNDLGAFCIKEGIRTEGCKIYTNRPYAENSELKIFKSWGIKAFITSSSIIDGKPLAVGL